MSQVVRIPVDIHASAKLVAAIRQTTWQAVLTEAVTEYAAKHLPTTPRRSDDG